MQSIAVPFFRHSDDAEVDALVQFEASLESDFYEVGERTVWRDYWIWDSKVKFLVRGMRYEPTPKELIEWMSEIDQAIERNVA